MGLISECKWQRKEQWTWRQNNRNYPIWTTEKNILKKVYRASGMITEVLTSVVLSFLGRRTLSTCGNFSQYWVLSNAWAIIASGMAWCKQNAAILPSPLKKKFFFSFFVKVLGSPDGSSVKKKISAWQGRRHKRLGFDPCLIPGSGRSPGEGNGTPLQYSCLGDPMDREAWQAKSTGSQKVGHNLRD